MSSHDAVTREATPLTPSVPPTRETEWTATLEAAGFDVSSIERNPERTLRPSSSQEGAAADAVAAYFSGDGLELHDTLGEGGMGVVRSGTQLRLGREVAVKTLRPENVSERTVTKLVREAWVIGSLEHPNIIPVHDIQLDDDGVPRVVLKRVEGDDWSALLAESTLEASLRILMQVCNAVHFAHSRGVIHRDIKPSNVMVGSFGEVYLSDWGLAVALEDDGTGRLPVISDVRTIAGTPVYMAPEQAWGGGGLGPWTDVYLLGATLYELVVGHPPHVGDSLGELMSAIASSEPRIPESVPRELRDILRRAMHRDPKQRFDSAQALRDALTAFLEHRGATRLVDSARRSLDELRELAQAENGSSADAQRLYDRCRFACRQALEVWPEADDARATLAEATVAFAEALLGGGAPLRARDLLRNLAEPPEALLAQVEHAVRQHEAEAHRLRGLDRDHDVATGRRVRFYLAGIIGTCWTLAPLAIEATRRTGRELTHGPAITWDTVGLVFVVGGLVLFRRQAFNSAVNRRLGVAAATTFGAQLMLHVGDAIIGTDALTTTVSQYPIWAAIAAGVSVGIDRAFLILAVLYLGAFVYLRTNPEPVFLVMAGLNALVLLLVVRISRRRRDDDAEPAEG